MKPTEMLKNEHRLIERMLSILEKAMNKEVIDIQNMERIIDFFRNFADRCHHGKEEDMLFPEMERRGIPREGGPIGVMLYEHNEGRNSIKKMQKSLEEIKKGEDKKEEFRQSATFYIELLRQHIFKEDNILFNMADSHLDQKIQEELVEKFEKFEKEYIGEGVHKRYHDFVEEMERIYKDISQ